MKLQKRITWVAFSISIISLFFYIAFKTFWANADSKEIIANIWIGIFGSSLLVFVPALITFYKNKTEAKQKIISELSKVENLVNDVHFQTTFLKGVDGKYNLDFTFENFRYDMSQGLSVYIALKDGYDTTANRVEKLYDTINTIDHYDFSFFDVYLEDYVGLFGSEQLIHLLSDKYFNILSDFMINNFPIPYGFGVRQYEFCGATVGQFFDIWFKGFLLKLEPIDKKLEYLKTILFIMRLRFYRTFYKETVNFSEIEKKIKLKSYIEELFENNNIKRTQFVNRLIKKLCKEKPSIKKAQNP